jgi:hypothetical protein
MREDPVVARRVLRSYRMMLGFYGFTLVNEATGELRKRRLRRVEAVHGPRQVGHRAFTAEQCLWGKLGKDRGAALKASPRT